MSAPPSPHMAQALAQAEIARHLTSPNPSVGAVIVAHDRVLGIGATQPAGGPHAEIMALRNAQERGFNVTGASIYVTLEPCSHFGRTPPCCDALAASGIARVVAAVADPNPQVSGRGFSRLREAGLRVEVGDGAIEAREQLMGFFSRMVRKRPWVRLKVASSLDGTTALSNGRSQWITGEAARADGHVWRARSCAVLTGVGTVLADNPRLDVRHFSTTRQPVRVVIDSGLRTPGSAALLGQPLTSAVLIYTLNDDPSVAAPLKALGATVVVMPPNGSPKLDLRSVMHDLAQRGVNEVHVEAGTQLNGSLFAAGLVDEVLHYIAPSLLGPGAALARLPEASGLDQGIKLHWQHIERLGDDLRVVARIDGAADF